MNKNNKYELPQKSPLGFDVSSVERDLGVFVAAAAIIIIRVKRVT